MKVTNILLLFSFFCFDTFAQEKCVRGAKPYGFFAEFLWTVNHLEYCLATDKKPVIYWGKEFAYYTPKGYNDSLNGWEYYFEPTCNETYNINDKLHTEDYYKRENNFSSLWWYVQYVDNIHLLPEENRNCFQPYKNNHAEYLSSKFNAQRKLQYPVGEYHLYDKLYRKWIHENILNKFVKIKENILSKILNFYADHMENDKKTIGIHLRGGHLRNEVFPVPISYILEQANKFAEQEEVQFFIATDQEPLLQEAINTLKGKVLYYPSQRFNKTTSPYPGVKLDPELGENILIEVMLLSLCDHLVHTISNVSTTALYFNPELEHTVLY